ncbi:MAG: hypothetical protein ACI9XO_001619 [Paraglaciecola sp.]|jgi:hypothetical protein
MIIKINWFRRFQWLLAIVVFCASCQATLTEDEKFGRFEQQYEKMVVKFFPDADSDAAIDSLLSKELTKGEILRKVEFCRANLDDLANFELEKISPENTDKLKGIFTEVKAHLREMETAATKVTD